MTRSPMTLGIRCPRCAGTTGCVDTRQNDGCTVRIRKCTACGTTIHTTESPTPVESKQLRDAVLTLLAALDAHRKAFRLLGWVEPPGVWSQLEAIRKLAEQA